MNIDPTDYEPRPADDFHAGLVDVFFLDDAPSLSRLTCLASRRNEKHFDFCHQFGCNFNELPHG